MGYQCQRRGKSSPVVNARLQQLQRSRLWQWGITAVAKEMTAVVEGRRNSQQLQWLFSHHANGIWKIFNKYIEPKLCK